MILKQKSLALLELYIEDYPWILDNSPHIKTFHIFISSYSEILFWLVNPSDTERKLNVHKTYKKRPEHLLNAFCTFNLCHVSLANINIFFSVFMDSFDQVIAH